MASRISQSDIVKSSKLAAHLSGASSVLPTFLYSWESEFSTSRYRFFFEELDSSWSHFSENFVFLVWGYSSSDEYFATPTLNFDEVIEKCQDDLWYTDDQVRIHSPLSVRLINTILSEVNSYYSRVTSAYLMKISDDSHIPTYGFENPIKNLASEENVKFSTTKTTMFWFSSSQEPVEFQLYKGEEFVMSVMLKPHNYIQMNNLLWDHTLRPNPRNSYGYLLILIER
jgi:hypothetical protein